MSEQKPAFYVQSQYVPSGLLVQTLFVRKGDKYFKLGQVAPSGYDHFLDCGPLEWEPNAAFEMDGGFVITLRYALGEPPSRISSDVRHAVVAWRFFQTALYLERGPEACDDPELKSLLDEFFKQ